MFIITSARSPLGKRVFAKFNQLGVMTGAMLRTVDANTFSTYESAAHVLNWAVESGAMFKSAVYSWHVEELR